MERDKLFDLDEFINQYVIKREYSMFQSDIENNSEQLKTAIENKSILVIGGAGSIGSNFIRVVLNYHPSELVVVDTNENALTELTRFLRSSLLPMPAVYLPYPMDYASAAFRHMFTAHRRQSGNTGFDIVANFSAHKHVRSEKDIYSIEALLRNNVINAKTFLDLLGTAPPDIYFCVSTDKAANPVNIMGASKRIMEDLIFSYSDVFPVKTARFANVAFSNGSLPAGFLERMRALQPLSAPSDIKRYFVSPVESGQICMLSAMLGENRAIFFPKLEEASMVAFDSIATELLHAHGYEVLKCDSDKEAVRYAEELRTGSQKYPVHYSVSDTSGEKAFEEFYTEDEIIDMTSFVALGVIRDKRMSDKVAVAELIDSLNEVFERNTCKEEIVQIIKSYLPNFEHIETGKGLDSKM